MTTLHTSLRWRCRTRLRSSSMPHGTTAAQVLLETSPAPGISSHQRASSVTTRCRTRRFISARLSGEITSLPGNAVINATLFTLNDQTPLVIGPSVSPIVSTQVWVHVLVQLGATAGTTQYRIKFWKVDDDNNQVPGTSEQYDYFFDNDFQVTTRYFRTTHKFTPAAGSGAMLLPSNASITATMPTS